MTPESLPPSEADGNDDPPIARPRYRLARLSDPADVRRDILGDEPEHPPGLVTLKLPVGALPNALDYIPAISEAIGSVRLTAESPAVIERWMGNGAISEAIGDVRLSEVQAAIDGIVRITSERTADQLYAQIAPSMTEINARLVQSMAPALTALNANMGAALYDYRRTIEAMNSMVVQRNTQFTEDFRRVNVALTDWADSMRRSMALARVDMAYVSHAVRPSWDVDGWMKANPIWPLVYDVVSERGDWERSLNTLAALPEFTPMVEELERSGFDAYAATITVRWVLRQVIQDTQYLRGSDMPPALLPYLQKAVYSALRGNQFLRLTGGVLLGNASNVRRGRPVGSTAIPDSEFPAHYVAAYRRLWRDNDHRPDDGDVFREMGISKSTFYAQKARLSDQGIQLPVPSEPAPPDPEL